MITKFENYLKESPDTVEVEGYDDLRYYDDDAVAFACKTNEDQTELKKLEIGDEGQMHSDSGLGDSDDWSYPGRLWLNSKLITFWVYPNDVLFRQIIKKLEEKLNQKIFDNGWRIEVIKREGELFKREYSEEDIENYYNDERQGYDESELIPLEDYAGSEDFSDLQKQMHLMGWAEKQKLKEKGVKLAPGFGADRTAWDQPRNLKYRQTIYQEKKNEKKS
jgi:hypothetical protein